VRILIFVLQEQLQQIRQQYIWNWILDIYNIQREYVLQYYDLFVRR